MKKFHFSFDKTKKAEYLKKNFLKKYKNYSVLKSDYIIVGGGDGYMLHCIKKYSKIKKPFFGINCGSVGFLMNRFKNYNLFREIDNSKKIIINPLQIINLNNNKKKIIAINEISFFRQSKQTASIKVKINNKVVINKLTSDGILVSTPAGSTAYNYSAGGSVLALNSGKLTLTPINQFRPRKWTGRSISNKSLLEIINLKPNKRPLALVADNVEIRNIKKVKIINNNKIKIHLLYSKNKTLEQRILLEKKRKKINR